MEISVSKKTTTNNYNEKPIIGEIIVKVKTPKKEIIKLEIDKSAFFNDLEEYVDKIENFGNYDLELEEKLLSYGINQQTFKEMKQQLSLQNTNEYSYSENEEAFTGFINFPWEEWGENLLILNK